MKKRLKNNNEDSLRELQDNMKCNNIWIIGIPEGEEKKERIEKLFEKIMTEKFPNLVRGTATEVQEAQKALSGWTQRGPLQDTS